MMYGFGYMPFGFLGILVMLATWALVIWAVVVFIKWVAGLGGERRMHDAAPREKTPFEILQERYARGEIAKKEYDQKKADLM